MSKENSHGARFSDGSTTKEIRADWWGDDEKVVIKKFNYGESRSISGLGLEVTSRDGELTQKYDLQAKALQRLLVGIVSWTFTDPSGSIMVKDENSIKKLNPDTADFILNEIIKYNESNRANQIDVDEAENLWNKEKMKGDKANPKLLELLEEKYNDLKGRLEKSNNTFQ